MMESKRIFVTVGTTKFDKLIETVSRSDVIKLLHKLGYDTIQFQTGCGECRQKMHPKVKLKYKPYFENFIDEIDKSDLVISHAGAGTCLEVLRRKKPLIVVVNEELMDNHQTELAQELDMSAYVYYCTTNGLKEVLSRDLSELKPYPTTSSDVFSNYLDKCMGFTGIKK